MNKLVSVLSFLFGFLWSMTCKRTSLLLSSHSNRKRSSQNLEDKKKIYRNNFHGKTYGLRPFLAILVWWVCFGWFNSIIQNGCSTSNGFCSNNMWWEIGYQDSVLPCNLTALTIRISSFLGCFWGTICWSLSSIGVTRGVSCCW